MMTNEKLIRLFKQRFPDIDVDDFRPWSIELVKGRFGITVYLKNGDILQYFPNPENDLDS